MNKGGRPPKYKPEYIKKVDDYLAERQDEVFEFHKLRSVKADAYDRHVKVKLPTIEGFALYIGVPRRTVFDWKDQYPEFSHSLDKILVEQQQRLIDSGLSGDYNPLIAKLILSANHGMKERSDVTTDDKPLNFTELVKQSLESRKPSNQPNTK